MKELKVNKGKMYGKVRMLFGAAALFLLLMGLTVQAAEDTTLRKTKKWYAGKSEWEGEKGYHLGDIAQTMECKHTADDRYSIAVSIKGSQLKPDKDYLKTKFDVTGATGKMSQKYKDQMKSSKIIWETAKVSGLNSSQVSSRVAKLKVNGKEIVLAAPYLCPDGYAGYAYFRHYFSYCPGTQEIYYTGTAEHVWLACTRGEVGVNEYHPKAFNHKLYRYYIEPNKYTVVYKGNGSTSGSTASQKGVYDESLKLKSNGFKRTGYTFTGWNTKSDGSGTAYQPGKSVKNLTDKNDGKVNLYAQWKPNTLKIRYHANEGQAKSGYTLYNQIVQEGGTELVKEIKYTTKTINLHNVATLLTRPGYSIDGAKAWSVGSIGGEKVSQENGSVPQVFKKMMEEKSGQTVTLYPNWKANSYLIHFDGNGATEGSMEDIKVSFDQEVILPENQFKRVTDQGESVFLGWNRNQEVHEAEFLNQGAVKNLAEEDGAVVTLYAIWDDCPQIEAVDRYFSLDFARAGKITEEELLRTASATDREDITLENRISAQIAEKGLNGSLSLYGYATTDFTEMMDSGSVSMTYRAADSAGNTAYETVTVFITNTDPLVRTDFKYTRFINEKYSTASYEAGGLHPESVWRKNPEYRSELQKALTNLNSDTPEIKYHFTHEEIVQAQKLYKK